MRTQGRKLSQQAREKLNTVLLDWLNDHKDQIDDCCLIAELFGKTRWREAPLERLRAGMRGLLTGMRVMCPRTLRNCVIQTLEERAVASSRTGTWERLSTPLKAAFVGLDHSTIIKSEAKQKEGKQ